MALVSDRNAPVEVPTTNALAQQNVGFEIPGPAMLRFGNADLFEMEQPLRCGEYIKVELTLRRDGWGGKDIGTEGENTRAIRTKLVSAKPIAEPYTPPVETVKPKVDEDQPGLYDGDDEDQDGAGTDPDAIPGYDGPR